MAATYCSLADYKAESLQQSYVATLSDTQITNLLLDVQLHIDSYIGNGWTPFDEEQEYVFPREVDTDSDGNSTIPRAVKAATILTADSILVKRTKGVSPDEIQSESDLGYSYTKFSKVNEQSHSVIPKDALSLIDKYALGSGGVFGL